MHDERVLEIARAYETSRVCVQVFFCCVCGLGGRIHWSPCLRIPEGLKVIALLSIGFPDEAPDPRARKPLKEIVFLGEYGENRD